IGLELWIAVTMAVVSAFTGYMEYNQMEDTLISYNQALANLESLKVWWEAQDKDKQEIPAVREKLVTKAEDVLNAELLRWIQAMESVLESEEGMGGGKDEEITDGTFTGPTDGPDSGVEEDLSEPRDLSPEDLAEISDELEEKFDLDEED
ncbi:MAG TPA: SLATT domain-containing protein, partial [Anaerolineales bacterium]|nr:SLATT domain-containing protein [Anaerolineales bacterium]